MKIRPETIAMLKFIDAQEFPETIIGLAQQAGMSREAMRTYLHRYHEAGLLNREERYSGKPPGVSGPKTVAYYWTNARAKELIAQNDAIPPKQPRPRPVINSVFALGSNALLANP